MSELNHALDAIGLARRREDARRIVIFMAERYPGQTSQTFAASRGVVADVLRQELLDQGLRVITLDPGRLWDGQTACPGSGKAAQCQTRPAGWAEVEPGRPEGTNGTSWSVQAKVEVKVFATETSEEIAQAQVEATVPPAEGTQGDAAALAQAATEIAERLIPELSAYRSGR